MKGIFFTVLMAFSLYSQAQYVTIPDTNFRNKLWQLFPTCFNALQQMDTTCTDIVNETYLHVGSLNIASIDGIQYFDNIRDFDCGGNQIASIPNLSNTLDSINFTNNQVSIMPALPNTLKYLSCGQNYLTTLPAFPDSLENFDCRTNFISTLPILPANLKILNCGMNLLTSMPILPNGLETLWLPKNPLIGLPVLPASLLEFGCSHLNLDTLPIMPNTLKSLYCSNNNLTIIKNLPDSLQIFYGKKNRLTSLPVLNSALQYLYCDSNQLTVLPPLPTSLLSLNCATNPLTALPSLPNYLYDLGCYNNPFLNCLPILPQSLTTLQIGLTNILCIPNLVNGLNIALPICQNGSDCEPSPTASGIVYNDINNNALYDEGIDYYIENLNINNTNNRNVTSHINGSYQIKLDSGVVNTFTCNPPHPYYNITPPSYTINPPNGGNQGSNFNFAISVIPNIHDLKIDIAKGLARPGFNQWVSTTINNNGTENATGTTLKLLIPATFSVLNASPAFSLQSGDTLIWNNIDINIFQHKTFALQLHIPANTVLGTPFQLQAWAIPTVPDTTPLDNHIVDDGTIQGSFDPNDKSVSKTLLDPNNVTDELRYTIRFQNTGTDTAFNIMIRDELSENLDISSFQMTGASHNYTYQIREKGLLEVFFQNILLPDSNINEPLSHGYFQYVIKPKATMSLNASITNIAAIYFDFNAPVWTNSVTSSFYPTGFSEFSKTEAIVYPNPTSGKINLIISEAKGAFTLSDMKGSVIMQINIEKETTLEISHLQNGIYIGKIETDKGIKVLKIVKQD